jgi:hypothetical protein
VAEDVDVADAFEFSAELGAGHGALEWVVEVGDGLGNVTPAPHPPPVREGAIEPESNHEDMWSSEH